MIPIRTVETEREDFDEPVVELWRENEFVGMVFWDGASTVVQIYPAAGDDVHDLEIRDLFRALEMAERIVDPLAFDQVEGVIQLGGGRAQAKREEPEDDWADEDPATVALLTEFDPLAAHRSEDGEGFFPRDVAERFVRKCDELRLAVVEMEGFDLASGELKARPGLELVVTPQPVMSAAEFCSHANTTALDYLNGWPRRESLVVAFVVQQQDGESIVA
ncbi:MAG: hypothetical protein ABFR89_04295 [Actinomycetota bacterium]